MIDIHTHIIPFVDDGSSSLEDSLAMVKHEISIGVDTIICTPHHIKHRYEKSVEDIKTNFNLLKAEVEKQNLPVKSVEEIKTNFNFLKSEVEKLNLPIKLLLGQEICYTHREDTLSFLNEGKLLTLNNSKYVLLEFSFTREPEDITDIIYNFSIKGYKVIVAHVERYEWITLDKVLNLKNEGAIIQVNSGSIVGETTGHEKRFVKKLFKRNLVDIVASDIHSFRKSTLDKALKKTKNPKLFNFYID